MAEQASRSQHAQSRKLIHEILPVGMLQCNCHIVGDPTTREAIVIDPGDDVTRILETLARHKLTLRAILITHAHIDHVGGMATLHKSTGAPVMMHRDDLKLYKLLPTQAEWLGTRTPVMCDVDQLKTETVVGSGHRTVGNEHVVQAVVGLAADGDAVTSADGAVHDDDVVAENALGFDGNIVVADGEGAILNQDIAPAGVDGVGVCGAYTGCGDGDMINGDVHARARNKVEHRGVVQGYVVDIDRRAIAQFDEVRAVGQ